MLERRVWSHTLGSDLYPNLYVILVAPPGVGKSIVLTKAEAMLRSVRDIYVAPSSVTTASLIDTINASQRVLVNGVQAPMIFHSLQVISSELGVFLPAYDPAFMNTLTKMYDGEFYEERRRTGKVNHIRIETPLLSILGASTPSYLNSFLPEGAWDQGFTSRTILVFHSTATKRELFPDDNNDTEQLYKDLVFDLSKLKEVYGKFEWEQRARTAIRDWHQNGEKPVPLHAKLKHYNSRRLTHIIKLSMISSIAKSMTLRITADDFIQAMEWLFEVEGVMPDIFTSMGTSVDARAMEDLYYIVQRQFARTGRPVGEHILVNFLKDRVPSYAITRMIEIMVKAKQLELKVVSGIPGYIPGSNQTIS